MCFLYYPGNWRGGSRFGPTMSQSQVWNVLPSTPLIMQPERKVVETFVISRLQHPIDVFTLRILATGPSSSSIIREEEAKSILTQMIEGLKKKLKKINESSANLCQKHCSLEHVSPQLISRGRREREGQTLYSKRGWVPNPPSSLPAAGVCRPNILLSPNKWKDNALPNLGFGSWPTKLSIMGVSWHRFCLTGRLFCHFVSC